MYIRPPDQKDNINNIWMKHQKDILLISGDLNLPDFNWTNQTVTNNQYPIMTNQSFLEIVADNGLEQIVDYPTYKDNTLDLILTPYSVFKQRCHYCRGDHMAWKYSKKSLKIPKMYLASHWRRTDNTMANRIRTNNK